MRLATCLFFVAGCATTDDGFALQIEARDAPVVVVRDGDGLWERVVTTPDGIAYKQIYENTYGVGALCGDASWKSATFIFDTQPRTVFLPCPVTTSVRAMHVRGTTMPMAIVWIDGDSVVADANGAFDLSLFEPGLHDVMAILPTVPPRIVAQRGLVISGDTHVDLPEGNAVEMTTLFPTVTGAEPDAIEVSADLNTGTDWISLGASASSVFVPPSSFLVATDRPAIAARAHGCTRQHPLSAANEPLELPSALVYTLDRSQIEWTADPSVAWDTALLEIDSTAGGRYSAYASASWRALNDASTIPIVALETLPGWSGGLPSLVPDKPAWFSFYVSQGTYDGYLTSCGANAQLDRW